MAVAAFLVLTVPVLALAPHTPARPSAGTVARAAEPTPSVEPSVVPSDEPSAAPTEGAPLYAYSPGSRGGGTVAAYRAPGCAPVGPAPARNDGYYPRVVIPAVGINVEIHEGDGNSPPDHQWVAWHYPGSAQPGEVGNAYIYAHAHGSPPNSAPGLFWPLHYMHNCDAVYVYTSPTTAFRYQAASVQKNWPSNDTRPLNPTNDDRVTLQTCNAWGDNDPKTIVVALRVDVPPPPAPAPKASQGGSGGSGGSGGGGGPGGGPTPPPAPTPVVPCVLNCGTSAGESARGAR